MGSIDWKPNIPESRSIVLVSVIDTTTWLANCAGALILDPVLPGIEKFEIPSHSFLVHHKQTNTRLLFDLGLRTNWKTHLSPHLLEELAPLKLEVSCKKDVANILTENGISPSNVSAIVFSHHHWDHVGDTTLFPGSTSIIVGPGYKNKFLPGWPIDSKAADTTSDLYEGRETIELDFSDENPKVCLIGGFQAYDYFDDGSFYILNTPGHTTGHLSALARTSVGTEEGSGPTFIFMGGDISHHCALFRPTKHYPMPDEFLPSPYGSSFVSKGVCPVEQYIALHRLRKEENGQFKARTTPFCRVPAGILDEDFVETQRSICKMMPFDSDENILTIFAHDDTLLDVIDFFPKYANDWKAKEWGVRSHWKFLKQLKV